MSEISDEKILGILVCKDIFFMGGVTATARSLGLHLRVCPGLSLLEKALSDCPDAKAVIVDMSLIDPDDPEAWSALRSTAPSPIILSGFGSHVDTRRFSAAKAAGFDQALPNSAFSGRMVEWLRSWMS